MISITTTLPIEDLKGWLAQRLSSERYAHSLGAHEKAVELAEKFRFTPEDIERAAIAGLLHDSAKLMRPPELLAFCDEHHLPIDEVDRQTPQTLHPFVGAELVAREFNIGDPLILDAIRFHTTGRAGMSHIEKVVYIADKIEGNTRNPLYIQRMTSQLDFRKPWSLDVTMLFILDSTIQFLMEKHQIIHPRTIEARNDYVARLREEKHL